MHIESYRDYCLSKKGVTEGCPFGPDVLVFKVMNKMFALTNISTFASINLKCDPELAITLRAEYTAVQPGFHMNKQHWNTVLMDGTIGDSLIQQWIDHSYMLIVDSLPKKVRAEWEAL